MFDGLFDGPAATDEVFVRALRASSLQVAFRVMSVQKGKPFFFLIKQVFEKVYQPTIFRRERCK
jgi:hypothetical protein